LPTLPLAYRWRRDGLGGFKQWCPQICGGLVLITVKFAPPHISQPRRNARPLAFSQVATGAVFKRQICRLK
jgi:hypothetical protein